MALLVVLLCGAGSAPASALFSFQGLGDLAGGRFESSLPAVSGDGRVVVGESVSARGFEGFRWEAGQMVGLGVAGGGPCRAGYQGQADFCSTALDVSGDGSVIVGSTVSGGRTEAFRWEGGVMTVLGAPATSASGFSSEARAVSADGSTVVGQTTTADGLRAYRWTEATGVVPLGTIGGVAGGSRAFGVSDDGAVVVGQASSPAPRPTREAFRWQAGAMQGLGDLPPGPVSSVAWDASADGDVVIGRANASFDSRPVRWVNGVIEELPSFFDPNELGQGLASAVSADGDVVVGFDSRAGGGSTAFIWDPEHGMRSLQALLEAELESQLDGWQLEWATDVSADGLTIVGQGRNPLGQREAWIAVIPEPGTALLLLVALVALAALRPRCTAVRPTRIAR